MSSKIELIYNYTQSILDECPNFDKKVYLLEDYKCDMSCIHVMYDTHVDEHKQLYFDKNGVFINGRSNSKKDKSKMYLHEFRNINFSDETILYIENEKLKYSDALDTRIPSKDIKSGFIGREFNNKNNHISNYVYMGKAKYPDGDIVNVYSWLFSSEEFDKSRTHTSIVNKKIRFDKEIGYVDNETLLFIRNDFRNRYGNDDIEWID